MKRLCYWKYILSISCALIGCSPEYSASEIQVKPKSSEKELKTLKLPGGCSIRFPLDYSFNQIEDNYIEVLNPEGVPSVFISTHTLTEYSPLWVSMIPDAVAAAIQFRADQEELEKEKTHDLENYGLNSEIIKWNVPYPLPHLKQPAFGIDYLRHNKSNIMGKHHEERAYCINIQILNRQYIHTINIKHITSPDTPIDANIPQQYYDIIKSITIDLASAPEQNIDSFNNAPAATSVSPVRYPTWTTVSIPNICEYQIPPTMELQAGLYREIANQYHTQVLHILDSGNRVVAQQKGLNSMDKEARSRYARVIIDYKPASDGFAQLLSNSPILDRDFITYFDTEMKSLVNQEAAQSTAAGTPVEITSWGGTQVVNINGIDSLKTVYSRSVNGAPAVSVSSFKIPVNNQILSVSTSYREKEASLWADDLKYLINTFDFSKK